MQIDNMSTIKQQTVKHLTLISYAFNSHGQLNI